MNPTPKQKRLLDFITSHIEKTGVNPSFQEVGLCFSTLILGVASLVLVCVAIDHIGNPGYQAIRNMLTPITGGRQ